MRCAACGKVLDRLQALERCAARRRSLRVDMLYADMSPRDRAPLIARTVALLDDTLALTLRLCDEKCVEFVTTSLGRGESTFRELPDNVALTTFARGYGQV